MGEFFRLVRRKYGQLGFPTFLKFALFRLLNVMQLHFHQRPPVQSPMDGYSVRRATSHDLAVLIEKGVNADLLPDLLGETNIVLVHEENGAPNALFWLGQIDFEFKGHDWVEVTLSAGDVCGRFLWVAPEARGKGIDPALNMAADRACRAAGYTHIVSYVDAFNISSLRADAKVGYEKIVTLTLFRVLGFGWLIFGRYVVVGRFNKSRPASFTFDAIRSFGGPAPGTASASSTPPLSSGLTYRS